MTQSRPFFGVEKFLVDLRLVCSCYFLLEAPQPVDLLKERINSFPSVWISEEKIWWCMPESPDAKEHKPFIDTQKPFEGEVRHFIEKETHFTDFDTARSGIRIVIVSDETDPSLCKQILLVLHHVFFDGRSCVSVGEMTIGDIPIDGLKWTFANPMNVDFPPSDEIIYPLDCLETGCTAVVLPCSSEDGACLFI